MAEEKIELINNLHELLTRLPIEMLQLLSCESKLKISLRKTLRHFDEDSLISELKNAVDWINTQELLEDISVDYRVKSYASIDEKYKRYRDSNKQLREVFNDLLGFRMLCESYENFLSEDRSPFEIADMSNGKKNDDGYRAVHMYFQRRGKNKYYYSIEIQISTIFDRKFNNWLHKHFYKREYPADIGGCLREKYESGLIKSEDDFKAALNNILNDMMK